MRSLSILAILTGLFCGSAATAASVQNIDLRLGFAGHSYFNAVVFDLQSSEVLFNGEVLEQQDDIWGLPRLFDFAVGQVLRFTATIDVDLGVVQSCNLGGLNCATGATLDPDPIDDLSIFYGALGLFTGGLSTGDRLTYDIIPSTNPQDRFVFETASDDLASWFVWRGEFTVLEDLPQPAPVPLPASVLLLPLGLAGLGLLRRRKKRDHA